MYGGHQQTIESLSKGKRTEVKKREKGETQHDGGADGRSRVRILRRNYITVAETTYHWETFTVRQNKKNKAARHKKNRSLDRALACIEKNKQRVQKVKQRSKTDGASGGGKKYQASEKVRPS